MSVENLTGYDDIVCKFALCTFNLLDRVSPGCSYEFKCSSCALREEVSICICYTTNTYEVHTFIV